MRTFLVAGEASGDRLGASLLEGLRQLGGPVEAMGVGGPLMADLGLQSLFPMDELSVMGIAEVLPRYPALRRRMIQTADAVIAAEPDVFITIDSPDFCLRVAERVRRTKRIRTVHYVAPSVWAWRPGRAAKMAPHVDQVLALLPFEPPYMEAAGMRCDFVGHPVVSEPDASDGDIAAFRALHGLGDAPYLLVLPGSRRSEVERLAPIFGAALSRLAARHSSLRAVVPVAPGREEQLREATRDWPGTILLERPDKAAKTAVFAGARAALAASGTVSLELAKAGTPMVIAYDMSWLSWQILSRMVRTRTVTLVNLIEGQNVVPEFLGPACRPDPIAEALDALWREPGLQTPALARTMAALGQGGEAPGLRAARAVMDGLAPATEAR
ncbi:lipid-A-disaccharide synthase [Palleronia marisminoris]|uniref:Lipid-A-disaccharide synthase n=1 Tax=Palleronia marisminoris TaxID=315423 RepID=A0A1Y5RAA6_9RHOB|nr:lipid-A-disaccharide synthase [Palleronia marisminoris]SFG08482.1 lipid-A-disaccharide synthase [Palleronia marisminoris]SLN11645.1 Lipid-A-disaccharide synthase [Palleronia marisminoris]